MKKIDIEAFGIGQQIWFNIGRLEKLEKLLGKPTGVILEECQNLSITNIVALLQVGMSQNGNKSPQYYMDKIDEAMDNGFTLEAIQMCIVKALAGSGVLSEEFYYLHFPEELTEEKAQELAARKNK